VRIRPAATSSSSSKYGARLRLAVRLEDDMETNLFLPPGPVLTPEQAREVETGINQMFEEMGHRPEPITGWRSSVQFPELGDITIVEAWLHGDHDGVRRVIELLHARSQASAERIARDPEFMAFLRDRMARLG
jgi:hypothetical protein